MTAHKNNSRIGAGELGKKKSAARSNAKDQDSAARIAAKKVIYAHAGKWCGVTLEVGSSIPVVRDNQKVAELPAMLVGDVAEVGSILWASRALKTSDIKKRLKELESLKYQSVALMNKLASFDPMALEGAIYAGSNKHQGLEGRIIKALGADNAAYMGLDVISVGLADQITGLESELKKRGQAGPGRPKDQAAYDVAIAAGKFFAKVTGERPTYGESPDGHSGKFTPFLRELYDAFGWSGRSLRAGLDRAIASVTEEDLTYVGKRKSTLFPAARSR